MLEDGQQRYLRHCQIDKKINAIFDGIRHQWIAISKLYMDKGEEGQLTNLVMRKNYGTVS